MIEYLFTNWITILIIILIYSIFNKIYNLLFTPFDELKFIEQINNQKKLEKKFNEININNNIPTLLSYYIN